MRTLRRPVAVAAGMTMAAGLAVAEVSPGATPADALSLRPLRQAQATAAPTPPPPPPPQPSPHSLAALRRCESGGNYRIATGNGYYGAYQFALATWRTLGYGGLPHMAPANVQDEAAAKLWSVAGWRPWPGCKAKLGLR